MTAALTAAAVLAAVFAGLWLRGRYMRRRDMRQVIRALADCTRVMRDHGLLALHGDDGPPAA